MRIRVKVETPLLISDKDYISLADLIFFDNYGKCKILRLESSNLKMEEVRWLINFMNENTMNKDIKRLMSYEKFEDLQKYYRELYNKYNNTICYENEIENKVPVREEGKNSFLPKSQIRLPIYTIPPGGSKIIPYIPGSSLKGALKKSVIYNYLKNSSSAISEIKKEFTNSIKNNGHRPKYANIIEDLLFKIKVKDYPDEKNKLNLMSFLQFSDLMPIGEFPKLTLRQLKRIRKDGSIPKKGIPVQTIMIEKGTFEGTVSLSIPKAYEKNNIKTEIIKGFRNLLGNNVKDEEEILRLLIRMLDKNRNPSSSDSPIRFYLGFGTGADKIPITGLDSAFIEEYEKDSATIKKYKKNRNNKKWPPETYFIVENFTNPYGKRPGLVSLEVI